jgi:hypothetical protein
MLGLLEMVVVSVGSRTLSVALVEVVIEGGASFLVTAGEEARRLRRPCLYFSDVVGLQRVRTSPGFLGASVYLVAGFHP